MMIDQAAHASGQPPRQITLATEYTIYSQVLAEERPFVVALPEGYDDSEAHYPVLYLLDGVQNIWHVAGSAELLTRTGHIPPLIIVGIKSVNRMRDFTPSAAAEIPYSGGADRFLEFISGELMPLVEATFRTHPFRILEGHSLGGLFTAHTLLTRPTLFDGYIVMSPAFWWNQEEMVQKAATIFPTQSALAKSLYLSIGSEDGTGMRHELIRFVEAVKEHGPPGLRWEHREMEGEGHMSAPLRINYFGLKFIFADMQLPQELWQTYHNAAFLAHENKIMARYGRAAKQSGENYVTLGLQLMKEENFAGAITVFKRNAAAYPIFPPNYAWLADAYEQNQANGAALAAYQQALERSIAIDYGQEENYRSHIERLQEMLAHADD